jgi:hypothetical protein
VKAALYLVVFANVAFLGWRLLIGEPAREPPAPVRVAPIPTLKLAVESTAPTQAGAPPATGSRCVTVGPFLDAGQAARAAALLHGEKLVPRQRSEASAGGTSFAVVIALSSNAEATRTAMRLHSAGLKDVEVREARLAAGAFPSHEEAEARVSALRKFGVAPAIEEVPRTLEAVWLDVDLGPNDHPVDVAAIQATAGGNAALVLKSCAGSTDPAPPAPASGPPSARGSAPVVPDRSSGHAAA